MDFIKILINCGDTNFVYIIIDVFSNMTKFIVLILSLKDFKEEVKTTLKMTTSFFFDNWVSLFGVLISIMRDRNLKFKIQFWRHIMKILESKFIITTTFYLQRDSQN